MNMESTNQYLKVLRKDYLKASKKKKSKLLDEAEKRTGLCRKHLTVKLRAWSNLNPRQPYERKKRKCYYDGYVKVALVKCWKIFDYACGQRPKPLIETEVDRLRKQKEIRCSDKVAEKLKKISFRTIDEKLKHQKEVERLRNKYRQRNNPLLYQKIPLKLFDEWDRNELGNIQIDLVEHCGQSVHGEYICSLSNVDITTNWWEGEAFVGKGQIRTVAGLEKTRKRFPFAWGEIHSDNGTEFINAHLFKYTQEEKLGFSRSRPYKKNDNCFVEQKNRTHIRRYVGHLRYETEKELGILNDLYRNELRLYKNFFQTTIKLVSKERIDSKIKRKYEKIPKTPYQRVMEAKTVSKKTKRRLKLIYDSLNPAKLKRTIDAKLNLLYKAYKEKNKSQKVEVKKKLKTITVRKLIAEPGCVSVR